MGYDRAEIAEAFDAFVAAADEAGRSGDWRRWVERFTPDVTYVEHHYGTFHGREAVLAWISETMGTWPFTHMRESPWDWVTIDAEQGWVVGQVQNRFVDPGDGGLYQAPNWTRLTYGGDGLFAVEEDVYNPATFTPMVKAWMAAWAAHHGDSREG